MWRDGIRDTPKVLNFITLIGRKKRMLSGAVIGKAPMPGTGYHRLIDIINSEPYRNLYKVIQVKLNDRWNKELKDKTFAVESFSSGNNNLCTIERRRGSLHSVGENARVTSLSRRHERKLKGKRQIEAAEETDSCKICIDGSPECARKLTSL